MSDQLQNVDHSALRTNQAAIILLLLGAFVLNLPWLTGLVALIMMLGTILKRPGFGFLYFNLLKPLKWVRPDILRDNPEPHRFAQGLGSAFLILSLGSLLFGLTGLGWGLTWLVIFLASLNLFVGFCAGCAVYYWLHHLHAPGFVKAPPQGTFPGMRPKLR